ncbi:MAG TPA: glutamate--tRNA ligase [Ktedonobacterales bacterium]|nr:glutamate--tRNA ligase [Ktedonobacterales bacterium]
MAAPPDTTNPPPTHDVRVRFAPSPTGLQHIGGYRTALFDWLLARHNGGKFLLRIEDTDTARTVPGAVEALIQGFRWLGLDWDEGPEVGGPFGPYFQTQRRDLYGAYAQQLIASGHAYRCFCSPERLQQVREAFQARNEPPRYDRHCRALSEGDIAARLASGDNFVVRQAVPFAGATLVTDTLRSAPIQFDNANLDDAVLLKSNGFPTYHLANVIDDHFMRISHVIRAEEWISSAPLHVMLYRALGWDEPVFAHVPDVLGRDGKKLSKRTGAVPLVEYDGLGYLPDAVLNYMALLGWSYDDKADILSRDELVRAFSLERVGTAAAKFDEERLLWFNGMYIRRLTPEELTERTLPFLERPASEGGLPVDVERPLDRAHVARVLRLEQERMKLLAEAPEMTAFFFSDDITYDPALLLPKGLEPGKARAGLTRAEAILRAAPAWQAHALEEPLRALVAELELKPVQLFTALRVAVTGRTVSPPLFDTFEVLGRERTLARVATAIARVPA